MRRGALWKIRANGYRFHFNLRMTSRSDEIQANMDAQVIDFLTSWLLLLTHVALVLIIKEFNDGQPAVLIVDVITETRGINDS
jgi:hypothetical protein